MPIPLVLYLPIGAESDLQGVVDLVNMRGIVWQAEDLGAKFDYVDIPMISRTRQPEYHEKLIETVVELDDDVMEKFFEGEMPDAATIKQLIRKGTMEQAFVPCSVWFGVQEQGRAAAARRSGRLHAFAARCSGHQRREA